MEFEEYVSAFLDGALSPSEETEFLHILSVSPEKRAMLHQHLGLRSMLAADARVASVPSHLDAAILGAAGIGAGIGAAGGAAAGGAALGTSTSGISSGAAMTGAAVTAASLGAGVSDGVAASSAPAATSTTASGVAALAAGSWWTLRRMLVAALLGVSLFTGGYLLSSLDKDSERETPDASSQPTAAHDALSTTGESASSVASSGATNAHDGATPTTQHTVTSPPPTRTVWITRVDTVYLPAVAQRNDTVRVTRIDTVLIAIAQTDHGTRPITIVQSPSLQAFAATPGRFDVEIQREHLTTWPYIDHARLGVDREQQHFALHAGYAFDVHHAVGVSLSEKSFAMEYYRIENDSLYLFQRQSAMLVGSGFYRFSQPLWTGVTPEFTLRIGGTSLGPVFGGRLAVQFAPLERLGIVIGADASLLAYKYKDNIFTSHTLGLTYGLRYRF